MGLLRATQKHRLGSRRSREGLQKLGWAKGRNIRIDFRWAAADEEAMQTVRAGTRRAAARPHSIQIKSRLTISFSIGFVDKLASKLRPLGADVHISAVLFENSFRVCAAIYMVSPNEFLGNATLNFVPARGAECERNGKQLSKL